jgi:hypothetical protein
MKVLIFNLYKNYRIIGITFDNHHHEGCFMKRVVAPTMFIGISNFAAHAQGPHKPSLQNTHVF